MEKSLVNTIFKHLQKFESEKKLDKSAEKSEKNCIISDKLDKIEIETSFKNNLSGRKEINKMNSTNNLTNNITSTHTGSSVISGINDIKLTSTIQINLNINLTNQKKEITDKK